MIDEPIVEEDPSTFADSAGYKPKDPGYLPFGWRMEFCEKENKWRYTTDGEEFYDTILPLQNRDNSPNVFKEVDFPDGRFSI